MRCWLEISTFFDLWQLFLDPQSYVFQLENTRYWVEISTQFHIWKLFWDPHNYVFQWENTRCGLEIMTIFHLWKLLITRPNACWQTFRRAPEYNLQQFWRASSCRMTALNARQPSFGPSTSRPAAGHTSFDVTPPRRHSMAALQLNLRTFANFTHHQEHFAATICSLHWNSAT